MEVHWNIPPLPKFICDHVLMMIPGVARPLRFPHPPHPPLRPQRDPRVSNGGIVQLISRKILSSPGGNEERLQRGKGKEIQTVPANCQNKCGNRKMIEKPGRIRKRAASARTLPDLQSHKIPFDTFSKDAKINSLCSSAPPLRVCLNTAHLSAKRYLTCPKKTTL